MSDLRILVVDDTKSWREELARILRRLGADVRVDAAEDYDTARQYITNTRYDLAIVDLALLGDPADPRDSDQVGMDLLRELRRSRYNQACGLIVLTGYPSTRRTLQALRDYDAYDFIEKDSFDAASFVESARAAILHRRLRHAQNRSQAQYRLIVTFNQGQLVGSELSGPGNQALYVAQNPARFDPTDLARRADNLNLLILRGGPDLWRPEAHSIGQALYQALAADQRILGDLASAPRLAKQSSELVLQFNGPAEGLGSPFELLHDGEDYLGFDHILTRRLLRTGPNTARKTEAFYVFVKNLLDNGEALRILVVGANSDGNIPAAEAEAAALAKMIKADLQQLGLASDIRLLTGAQASYSEVGDALRDGRYHIFHYAGHGRYDDKLPEVGGLVLQDGDALRTLTANELNSIVRDTELRMVFLSCCLSARTAARAGSGDFHGMLEALARADVPMVLGYRWTVLDEPAQRLALDFYQALWRSLAPGEALLEARRKAARGHQGRSDETWAAPVLLMQNV